MSLYYWDTASDDFLPGVGQDIDSDVGGSGGADTDKLPTDDAGWEVHGSKNNFQKTVRRLRIIFLLSISIGCSSLHWQICCFGLKFRDHQPHQHPKAILFSMVSPGSAKLAHGELIPASCRWVNVEPVGCTGNVCELRNINLIN